MIEQLARAGAQELRDTVRVDSDAGLADLHVRHARHRRQAGLTAVAAVVLAVGLGAGAGVALDRAHDDRAPTPTRPVTSPDSMELDEPVCAAPRVDCRGDGTYRFELTRPVVWALPPGFGANAPAQTTSSGGEALSLRVESSRQAPPDAGVVVLERVRASRPDGRGPAVGVNDSPHTFVNWVATRPYLDAGTVERTTLDGHAAWRVRVTLASGAARGGATCVGRYTCHAVTYQPGAGVTGIWGDMSAQYTAIRLPGAGTTVVWSWIFSSDTRHLGTVEEAVHSISWPPD
jgi:hypothetical protein